MKYSLLKYEEQMRKMMDLTSEDLTTIGLSLVATAT